MSMMNNPEPLEVLLGMRKAIAEARFATEGYGYEDFNDRMKLLQREAIELFRLFDKEYTDA